MFARHQKVSFSILNEIYPVVSLAVPAGYFLSCLAI